MRVLCGGLLAVLAPALASCGPPDTTAGAVLKLGNIQRGIYLIQLNGCGSCHIIPGIDDADGDVGPPLILVGRRTYIAGVLRNTPENMMYWIQYPQRVVPGNAMPMMGIDAIDARDIMAYLYTLR